MTRLDAGYGIAHATVDTLHEAEVGFVLKWRDSRVAKKNVREHHPQWQRHTQDVRVAEGPAYLGVGRSSEAELIDRLRSGDEAAFVWLVDTYSAPLRRLAGAFVSVDSVAEEVVQETSLAVLTGNRSLRGTLQPEDVALQDPYQSRQDAGRARKPHDPILRAGSGQ